MKEDKKPSRYPEEIPMGDRKEFRHGVIVDVVQNEVCPKSATNPVTPADTDAINTQFAKQEIENNM
ncbi:MAG: hypothetical protein E7563_05385 [Ruminococcaceae bacterium]|nr:hypothetical protein [Oscillospiraceae bacterium]